MDQEKDPALVGAGFSFPTVRCCYIDEIGGFEAPNQSQTATPLMVIAGLIVLSAVIAPLAEHLAGLRLSPPIRQLE